MPTSRLGLLGCALFVAAACQQLAAQSSLPKTLVSDVSHAGGETGYVLTAPLHWHGNDWAAFGAVLGGTFALSFLDQEVNDYLQEHRSQTADKLADFGISYGEPITVVTLTGCTYALGLLARSEKLRETAVILSGALLPSGIIQTVAKRAAGRARPHLGLGNDVFDPFRNEEAYYSFFSGHTMVAMATSHAFAKQFPHPLIKVALYSMGAIGGFARLYEEDHWLSDVVLGGVLGIVSVNTTSKWLARQKNGNAMGHLQWRIFAPRNGLGMSLNW